MARLTSIFTLVVTLLLLLASQSQALQSFPSAYGFGSQTPGGRGGRVLKVTNLNDGGVGSFRWAVTQSGPRIVIFDVSGIIELSNNIEIRNPNITIAGQTAPSTGIVLKNAGIHVMTHDVIIRHLSSRPGDDPGQSYESRDALSLSSGASNIVLDHLTLAWSTDEVLGFQESGYSHVTVQWSAIAEPLHCSKHPKGCHGYNILLGGKEPVKSHNVSMHHNLIAYGMDRNPRIQGVNILDYRYNLTYGSRYAATASLSDSRINMVNNLYQDAMFNIYPDDIVTNFDDSNFKVFFSGNLTDTGISVDEVAKDKNIAISPFPAPHIPPTHTKELFNTITNIAGAMPNNRNSIDLRLLQRIQSQVNGYINSPKEVGGYSGITNSSASRVDSDNDGLPNTWEQSHELNSNNPADANQIAFNQFTHIENWINQLAGDNVTYPTPIPTNLSTSTPSPISVDLDKDYDVDFIDFSILISKAKQNIYLFSTTLHHFNN